MEKQNYLGTENIFKLVMKIAFPSMIAQFVAVLYSIVDRMFVGNIPEIGDKCLAGIGVCAPILTFIGAFCLLVGVGGSPLMSIALGEGNKEKAKNIVANAFVLLSIIAVILTATGLLVKEPMLKLFGATEKSFAYANQYFTICISGISGYLFSVGMCQFIVAQGKAKTGMFSVVIGAILNIILDPIFIYVFKMGIQGAALATIISQFASALFVLIYLFTKSEIKITFKGYSFKIMRRIMELGLSPFLIIGLDSVMLIAVNAMLSKFGGTQDHTNFLITVNTIVQSFMLVITMPLAGISGGTQCILAFNYGAGNSKRVISAQKVIMGFCFIYTLIFFIIAFTASQYFVALFTNTEAIAKESVKAIKTSTLCILFLGIQYEIVDGFTALGQVKLSLFLSLWRKGAYFLAVFIIPVVWNADNIFYAEPISDFMAIAMSLPMYLIMIKKILNKREAYLKSQLSITNETTL